MRRPRNTDKPLNQQERADCYRSVLRGKSVKNFYASDMWSKHLEPFLKGLKQEILMENHFRPGSDVPAIERIALLNAFNGGRIHILDAITDQLAQWINLANHAEAKLSLDRKLQEKTK